MNIVTAGARTNLVLSINLEAWTIKLILCRKTAMLWYFGLNRGSSAVLRSLDTDGRASAGSIKLLIGEGQLFNLCFLLSVFWPTAIIPNHSGYIAIPATTAFTSL